MSHFIYYFAECHYTDCRYAECRCAMGIDVEALRLIQMEVAPG